MIFTNRAYELLDEKEKIEEEIEELKEENKDYEEEFPDCSEEEIIEKQSYIEENKFRILQLKEKIGIIDEEVKEEIV